MTFDKMTLKAQEVVAAAQRAASEYGHQQIDVEHLLQAMLHDNEGVPTAILKKLGSNIPQILAGLEQEIQRLGSN